MMKYLISLLNVWCGAYVCHTFEDYVQAFQLAKVLCKIAFALFVPLCCAMAMVYVFRNALPVYGIKFAVCMCCAGMIGVACSIANVLDIKERLLKNIVAIASKYGSISYEELCIYFELSDFEISISKQNTANGAANGNSIASFCLNHCK